MLQLPVKKLLVGAIAVAAIFSLAAPAAQMEWTPVNAIFGQSTLQSVINGNGQWVVVGENGMIGTSPDGQRWTRRNSGTTANLGAIVYGGGRYFAGGAGGLILASNNGTEWTQVRAATANSADFLRSAAYGNGRWVFVCGEEKIYTSSDGTNWSETSINSGGLIAVTFASGQFVGVGWSHVSSRSLMMTSLDGLSWTRRSADLQIDPVGDTGGVVLRAIAFGSGQFVAVGDSNGVATSSDGITWTGRRPTTEDIGSISYTLTSIAYGNGSYVVGTDTWGQYLTSSDGLSWKARSAGTGPFPGIMRFTGMAFADGTFVASGLDGHMAVKTAVDDWTLATNFFAASEPRGAIYGGGRFVLIFGDGSTAVSTDGWRWSTRSGSGYARTRPAFGKGVFVTGSYAFPYVYVSGDGIAWTEHPLPDPLAAVTFAQDRFVGVGRDGIATSPDGSAWTKQNAPAGKSYTGVVEGNGRFVAVGLSGAVATSPDGLAWTSQPEPASGHFSAIAFGAGRFVAVEKDAVRIWSSTDGVSWTSSTPTAPPAGYSATGGIADVIFGGNRFVATVGSDVLTSPDGIAWTVSPRALGNDDYPLFLLTYGNETYLAVGRFGAAYRSTGDRPSITIESVSPNAFVNAGEATTLTVAATGTNLSYQWYRGAAGDTTHPLGGANGASFTTTLTGDDHFWVRVSSGGTTVDSATITLRVNAAPAIADPPSREFEVLAGAEFQMPLTITGVPAPAVQWYLGQTGDTSQPIASTTGPTLVVTAGAEVRQYWARASNSSGTADSASIRVTPWQRLAGSPQRISGTRQFGSMLVAVGGDAVSTSPDGYAWTKVATLSSQLRDIEQGAGLYVAVGGYGIFWSADLASWTPANVPAEAGQNSASRVARGNGVFVTAGAKSFYSADGKNWTSLSLPAGIAFRAVVFAGAQFVAVGTSDVGNDPARQDVGVVFTSADGIHWTRRATDLLPETEGNAHTALDYVVFADGKFLAAGSSQPFGLVSVDGVRWLRVAIDTQRGGRIGALAHGEGLFAAATDNGGIFLSSDAIVWTASAAPFAFNEPTLMATPQGGLIFAGTGTYQTRLLYAYDRQGGWTFRAGNQPDDVYALHNIAAGAGQALASNAAGIFSSTDGRNWQPAYTLAIQQGTGRIVYANGRYVALSDNPDKNLMRSRDGRRWTSFNLPNPTPFFTNLAAAGDRLFALAENRFATSLDSENWTVIGGAATAGVIDVAFGNGVFVAVTSSGGHGGIATSTDGVSWSAATVAEMQAIVAVAFGKDRFVLIGYNSGAPVVLASTDGRNWTAHPGPVGPSEGLSDLLFCGDRFFLASFSHIYFSFDGVSWQEGPVAEGTKLLDAVNGTVLCGANLVRARDPGSLAILSVANDQEVPSGATATLSVSAQGANLRYQWYEGAAGDRSAPVAGATAATFTTPAIGTLRSFWVRVGDGAATVDSRAVTVAPESPPVLTSEPFDGDVVDNSDAAFLSVEAASILPLSYQWYVGERGDIRTPVTGATASTFIAPRLGRSARFWARVSNAHGSVDSRTVTLTRWTAIPSPQPGANRELLTTNIAYGQDRFVVAGPLLQISNSMRMGGMVAATSDGASWSQAETTEFASIAFGLGRFIAVPFFHNPANLHSSGDGLNWSPVSSDAISGAPFAKIFFAGDRFFAVNNFGRIASSADGTTWNSVTIGSQTVTGVAYGDSKYVASCTVGSLFQSSDGVTWRSVASGVTTDISSVAYGAGKFIAALADGNALMSSDGATWSPAPIQTWTGSNVLPRSAQVVFTGGRFFASQPNGNAAPLTSPDGLRWGASLPAANFVSGADCLYAASGSTIYRSSPVSGLGFLAQPISQSLQPGTAASLVAIASGEAPLTYQWRKDGVPLADGGRIGGSRTNVLTLTHAVAADQGSYDVVVTGPAGSITSMAAVLTVLPSLAMTAQPASQAAQSGGRITLGGAALVPDGSTAPQYQWQANGLSLTGASQPTLTLNNFGPADTGVYSLVARSDGNSVTSDLAIVGLLSPYAVVGDGEIVATNITHPNGNHYDQVLLNGPAATVSPQGGRVMRTSFIDANDDIVQVEFAGAGALSLVLDDPSGPARPAKYNQAIDYVKGHAGIVVAGANETTNLLVFTVGRATAVNQSLFKDGIGYDGVADVAFIAIMSKNGKFGGLRASNTRFSAVNGVAGVYAPGVEFTGPLFIGDIDAGRVNDALDATPMIIVGAAADARITGGDLRQTNGLPVQVKGLTQLKFTDGTDSAGTLQRAQHNRAVLQQDGQDVTAQIVVNPTP